MTRTLQLRRGAYVDSVTLMQVSRQVSGLPGVQSALVAMATELNLDLALSMGFDLPDETDANAMLVAIEADGEEQLAAALAEVEVALSAKAPTDRSAFGGAPPPVTVRAAARGADATVAVISTPGEHAFVEAVDAVDQGLHTMVFSDNVPLAQEVALKEYADPAGVLVMGPDCGTAVIGGVGLGFANVVRPGPVGIVAASGTGAQHLMTLLDSSGVGISHCLGTGGRDLSAAVGGRSTLRALDLLAEDPDTELVLVVSKPPAPGVAERVREHAQLVGSRSGKQVLFGLLGPGQPDLTEFAASAVAAVSASWRPPAQWVGRLRRARDGGFLRGLFSGGTLCDEAMILAADRLGRVASNIPLREEWDVGPDLSSQGHTMIDFGDDRLTRGRPHPMIDSSMRVDRLFHEAADPQTGVLLLDVVLGHGAAADPAADLDKPIRAATAAGVPVLVSLVGTPDDPQGLQGQVDALRAAGAWVFGSNAQAARTAVDLVLGDDPAAGQMPSAEEGEGR